MKEENGFYIVSVSCRTCQRQIGVAMVGVESDEDGLALSGADAKQRYADPELTEEELERLAVFPPISFDDVLEAHQFFENLDANWSQFIPAEIRERCIDSDTELTA